MDKGTLERVEWTLYLPFMSLYYYEIPISQLSKNVSFVT